MIIGNPGGRWRSLLPRTTYFYWPHPLLFDSRNSGTIYVATDEGLLFTTDAGETWADINDQWPGLPRTHVAQVVLTDCDERTLYAATAEGLFALALED